MGDHAITWEGEELPRRLWRLEYFDAAHLPAILRSKTGEILRLHSADYHQTVLYQVQEIYSGAHLFARSWARWSVRSFPRLGYPVS